MSGRARRRETDFDPREALRTSQISFRVRYVECDPMGVAHHSTYPIWFEMGRTEMLRAQGGRYRDLESAGVFLVVSDLTIRFRAPARYDDELVLQTHLIEGGRARIRHGYELFDSESRLVAKAVTTLACVDRDGRLQPIPSGFES